MYRHALRATLLWSLGPVAGMEIDGAPFFIREQEYNGWTSPADIGTTKVRMESLLRQFPLTSAQSRKGQSS
jgi:PhnB protein